MCPYPAPPASEPRSPPRTPAFSLSVSGADDRAADPALRQVLRSPSSGPSPATSTRPGNPPLLFRSCLLRNRAPEPKLFVFGSDLMQLQVQYSIDVFCLQTSHFFFGKNVFCWVRPCRGSAESAALLALNLSTVPLLVSSFSAICARQDRSSQAADAVRFPEVLGDSVRVQCHK